MEHTSTPEVRVRFAPSPTGFLHLGNIRTALFDFLAARSGNGTFILRLEDTDQARLVPEAVDQIKDSLNWLGLTWDEGIDVGGEYGPYIQSERLKLYQKYAQQLVDSGAMYPCWCSAERLDDLRRKAQASNRPFKYDRHCLSHPQSSELPHVLRFKIPDSGDITWNDLVKGPVSFAASDLDDFVALKSDGYPTYNFAVVIDDHLMEISHVLRGDEFISTTPKNILVYRALGWETPAWVHLPPVLGTDKTKLSKRHGAKTAGEYRDEGYLPEAVVNFLALLGWHPGDGSTQEVFSSQELIERFSLDRIQKSPAVFDPERLLWLNGVYIRNLTPAQLDEKAEPFWSDKAKASKAEYRQTVIGLVQDRLKLLSELPELTDFFFTDPGVPKQLHSKLNPRYLDEAIKVLDADDQFTRDSLETVLRSLAETLNAKPGELFTTLRIAATGKTAAPGLFETLCALGKTTTLRRFQAAKHALAQ